MTSRPRVGLSLCAAVALGLAVSTGYPAGIVTGIAMPVVCMIPASRRFAFASAFGYYSAGLWPMIPGARHFTGQSTPFLIATLMWIAAAVLFVRAMDISMDTQQSPSLFMAGPVGRDRRHTSTARPDRFHFTFDGRGILVSRHRLDRFDRNRSTSRCRPCV